MKPQHAIPLLSAAASFMVLGLVLGGADAQPPETPTVRVSPGGVAGVRPRLGDAVRAQVAESEGDTASGGTPGAPGSGTGLPQFETGVEYEAVPPGTRVTFNLEDADLPDLVRLISNLTGKRFILSSKVRSLKATVFAPTKVTVAEAYNAFLSILEVNGMTVVPAGRYLKISETANIEGQPIPLYTGSSPTPNADRYVTRLHRVENVSAEDAAQLLSRFKSQTGAVTAYAPLSEGELVQPSKSAPASGSVVETKRTNDFIEDLQGSATQSATDGPEAIRRKTSYFRDPLHHE